jgi:hypothetical protein
MTTTENSDRHIATDRAEMRELRELTTAEVSQVHGGNVLQDLWRMLSTNAMGETGSGFAQLGVIG